VENGRAGFIVPYANLGKCQGVSRVKMKIFFKYTMVCPENFHFRQKLEQMTNLFTWKPKSAKNHGHRKSDVEKWSLKQNVVIGSLDTDELGCQCFNVWCRDLL